MEATLFPREVWFHIFEWVSFEDFMSCLLSIRTFHDFVHCNQIRLLYERVWREHRDDLDPDECALYVNIPDIPESHLPRYHRFLEHVLRVFNGHLPFWNYNRSVQKKLEKQPLVKNVLKWNSKRNVSIDTSQLSSVIQCFLVYMFLEEAWIGSPLPSIFPLLYESLTPIRYHPKEVDCLYKSKVNFPSLR